MIGVYSALFGNYDKLLPIDYDVTLFTDQNISVEGWQAKIVNMPYSNRYNSRFYFTSSCLALPECEFTILHGTNAILKHSPDKLVSLLPDGIDLACCLHHHRSNVFDEARAVIGYGKDKKAIVNKQMRRYKKEGFKGDNLSATIMIIRRNTPALKEFEALWWDEVRSNSYRDQLSFDYARWKLDFPVHVLSGTWNDYIRLHKHRNGKNYNDQK